MDSVNHELPGVNRYVCSGTFSCVHHTDRTCLAIVIISKILGLIIKDEVKKPAAAPVQPAVSDEADKETLAVLVATIGVDLNLTAGRV